MRTAHPATTIDSLEGYLHRRRRSALPLTPGEAATIAIALVRGCADASLRARGGQWRLTAEGRPVLVPDPDADDVLAATARILDELVTLVDADVRPGFARLRDLVLTEPPRAWDIAERRLLAVVEPQPIVLGPLTPGEPQVAGPPHVEAEGSSDAARPPLLDGVRRVLRRGASRRGLVLSTVGVAALVVVGASSIPAAPSETTTSVPDASLSPGSSVFSSTASPAARPADDDVRSAALPVLRQLAACTDAECASTLREASADPGEPALLDPAAAELEVVDDFGGLAVIRLTGADRTQYVTLVREKDRWLVRSVRDVADQPS
ncbi:hypothetical protein [Microbacterium sp. Bi128]|uniref:hypothetical protein n=1 Tax=Microbacterium sp. Bi128 TaxID=2821115 RepID=UPI001DAEECB7|nr:hypothetical protein [Microbacterium sp. Bi128]CAH0258620.1 hypothetical protein SRABI128_03087 [Microbacterium sp. Bi128]